MSRRRHEIQLGRFFPVFVKLRQLGSQSRSMSAWHLLHESAVAHVSGSMQLRAWSSSILRLVV